jgi:hypothetical protein
MKQQSLAAPKKSGDGQEPVSARTQRPAISNTEKLRVRGAFLVHQGETSGGDLRDRPH